MLTILNHHTQQAFQTSLGKNVSSKQKFHIEVLDPWNVYTPTYIYIGAYNVIKIICIYFTVKAGLKKDSPYEHENSATAGKF